MMQRRQLFGGPLLGLVLSVKAYARPQFPNDGLFHWYNPGGDPYVGSVKAALAAFAREGVRSQPLDATYKMYQEGRASPGTIRPGERYDYMMSGKGVVQRQVVAETHIWPLYVSKQMSVYMVQEGEMISELGLPAPCGNWTWRTYKFGHQLECMPCTSCS